MSDVVAKLGEFLPSKPKRWREMLAMMVLMYGFKETFPGLFSKSVRGDVVVITGASGGLGRRFAVRFAKLHACPVALIDLDLEAVQKVAEECKAFGVKAKGYKCDVTDRERVYEVTKEIEEDFGRVDILINNAGIVGGKKLVEADDKRIELTLKVNTLALMWMTKAFLPGMLKRNKGHLVTIASSAGRVGVPGLADYCASKAGAVFFDEAMRLELRNTAIKTTCVCPMYINTGMFEGAKLRPKWTILGPLVNLLFGVLEPDYVADQVVRAVLQNQAVLVLPFMAYTTAILKAVFPTSFTDQLLEDLGVTSSMDEFKQTRPA